MQSLCGNTILPGVSEELCCRKQSVIFIFAQNKERVICFILFSLLLTLPSWAFIFYNTKYYGFMIHVTANEKSSHIHRK